MIMIKFGGTSIYIRKRYGPGIQRYSTSVFTVRSLYVPIRNKSKKGVVNQSVPEKPVTYNL